MALADDVPCAESYRESALFAADRGAYWGLMRGLGRVVWTPLGYFLTHRDDVLAALRDPDTFVKDQSTWAVVGRSGKPLEQLPASCDPQEHVRFSRVLLPLLSPSALAPFEPALRAYAAAMVDAVATRGRCEATLGDAYPCGALLLVCGLPVEHEPAVTSLVRALGRNKGDGRCQRELLDFLLGVAVRNWKRRPGFLWELFDRVDCEGDLSLTFDEVSGLLLSLFTAGIDPIGAMSISFALWRLACDPCLRSNLRENPELVGAFVDEVVRLDSSPAIYRSTTREVVVGGVTIPAGAVVWLALESAAREDGGDELVLTAGGDAARRQRHLGFGAGIHRCPAFHLARMELTIFLSEWLKRISEFEIEPGFAPAIVYQGATKPDRLPLVWDTA